MDMFDISSAATYCEQMLHIGWEPINTISNIALVVAGTAAFYVLRKQKGVTKYLLPLLLILAGVGSSWWHVSHTVSGHTADVFFIFVFASVASVLLLRKLVRSWVVITLLFFTLLSTTLYVEQFSYFNGSLPYIVLFAAFGITTIFYTKKFPDTRALVITAILTFGLAIIFRSIDMLVCPTVSIGTRFLWHILVAAFGYQIILLVARNTEVTHK